jgi:branched-chain amino acid transport system ATP-binding protein
MSQPRLRILDEPSLGLAAQLVLDIVQSLKLLREQSMPILLIEQNTATASVGTGRAAGTVTGARKSLITEPRGV